MTARELLDQIDSLQATLAAATEGPWEQSAEYPDAAQEVLCVGGSVAQVWEPADAALIVAAVNALPQLTAALRAVLDLADQLAADRIPTGLGHAVIAQRIRNAAALNPAEAQS